MLLLGPVPLKAEWLGISADRSLWSTDRVVHDEASAATDSARHTNAADCITMLYHECSINAAY